MIRLLRVELRRNALLVVLPVVALLWLASPIARHLYPIALWPDRSTDIQSAQAHATTRGWAIANWLVANATQFAVDRITLNGQTWTTGTATWSATGATDHILSFHRVPGP